MRIPVVDDDFNRHTAAPHAALAVTRVSAGSKVTVAAFTVDLEIGGRTVPGWGSLVLLIWTAQHLQLAGFVVLHWFKARIRYWNRLTANFVTDLELMFGLRGLADGDGELPFLAANNAIDDETVAEVAVAALIEGTRQADAGLYGYNPTCPFEFVRHVVTSRID
jgi:hypothetical protein